jgi:hypothetical protein
VSAAVNDSKFHTYPYCIGLAINEVEALWVNSPFHVALDTVLAEVIGRKEEAVPHDIQHTRLDGGTSVIENIPSLEMHLVTFSLQVIRCSGTHQIHKFDPCISVALGSKGDVGIYEISHL